MTSRLEKGKPLTFFYSMSAYLFLLNCTYPSQEPEHVHACLLIQVFCHRRYVVLDPVLYVLNAVNLLYQLQFHESSVYGLLSYPVSFI